MDLIDRQVAVDAIQQHREDVLGGYKYDEGVAFVYAAAHNHIIDVIKHLPSAQPERKKGRWIPVDSYSAFGGDEATWMAHGNPVAFYYCSECKEQAYAGEDGESLLTAYCPNCGADMRGGEECTKKI